MNLFELEPTLPIPLPSMKEFSNGSPDVVRRLSGHSWDFANSKSQRQSIHAVHPYPAKFIPEIPRALIAEFPPSEGSCVLDPFCGSGTTLVEAQLAGFDAVGVDLNPIACRISRVKTGSAPRLLGLAAARCITAAQKNAVEVPQDIPNLGHWFQADVSETISALKAAIHAVAPSECVLALELALSSIIVRVSNQDSDTRYAAVTKNITRQQVFDLFLEAAGRIETALMRRPATDASVQVLESDILALKAESLRQRVGLVVTSPPYPNAYEYWLYHKYRMWWLGHDALRVRKHEIGARAHFFGGRAKAGDFQLQMAGVFRLLDSVCTEDATVCFVVGDSKIHGHIVDNAEALKHAAAASDFIEAGHIMRNMRASKKSFNLAHARIRQEHIVVFKRRSAMS
jgi:SAM-dependent methyltransferase